MWAILAMAATRKKGGKVLSLHLSLFFSSNRDCLTFPLSSRCPLHAANPGVFQSPSFR